jgi:hypothetical protein
VHYCTLGTSALFRRKQLGRCHRLRPCPQCDNRDERVWEALQALHNHSSLWEALTQLEALGERPSLVEAWSRKVRYLFSCCHTLSSRYPTLSPSVCAATP